MLDCDLDGSLIETTELPFKAITYDAILAGYSGNFAALDVSVGSTGWVKRLNGVLTYGYFHLESKTDLDRRQEFRTRILSLLGKATYQHIFIEDVISGGNFKTDKILMQLNPIIDDMAFEQSIHVGTIMRVGNSVWKKHLRIASNYAQNSTIIKLKDKLQIQACLAHIGFSVVDILKAYPSIMGKKKKIEETSTQDILDAMGIAVGCIFNLTSKGLTHTPATDIKLCLDITSGYSVYQYNTYKEAEKKALKVQNRIEAAITYEDFSAGKRDFKHLFRHMVERKKDSDIFIIYTPTDKLGVIAIQKKLSLEVSSSYIVCYKTKRK